MRRGRRLYATPLVAVLVVLAATDVAFAADSIPSIFAVTRDPLIVFAANVMALVGLPSLFVLLEGMRDRFVHLNLGLAAVLVLTGIEMATAELYHPPAAATLIAVVVLIGASVLASPRPSRPAAAPTNARGGAMLTWSDIRAIDSISDPLGVVSVFVDRPDHAAGRLVRAVALAGELRRLEQEVHDAPARGRLPGVPAPDPPGSRADARRQVARDGRCSRRSRRRRCSRSASACPSASPRRSSRRRTCARSWRRSTRAARPASWWPGWHPSSSSSGRWARSRRWASIASPAPPRRGAGAVRRWPPASPARCATSPPSGPGGACSSPATAAWPTRSPAPPRRTAARWRW